MFFTCFKTKMGQKKEEKEREPANVAAPGFSFLASQRAKRSALPRRALGNSAASRIQRAKKNRPAAFIIRRGSCARAAGDAATDTGASAAAKATSVAAAFPPSGRVRLRALTTEAAGAGPSVGASARPPGRAGEATRRGARARTHTTASCPRRQPFFPHCSKRAVICRRITLTAAAASRGSARRPTVACSDRRASRATDNDAIRFTSVVIWCRSLESPLSEVRRRSGMQCL